MSLNGGLVGVTSHITPLPAGEGLGEGPLSCGLETVRQKTPQRVSKIFFFSQISTEEQNTQHFTEALRLADSTERYS